MNTTHSTKKRLLAQALGITAAAVLGVLANGGTAAADGHNVVNPDATWGAADVGEQRGQDIVPAVQSYDTSSYPAESSYPAQSGTPAVWPKPLSNVPSRSWPGNGWGVADG